MLNLLIWLAFIVFLAGAIAMSIDGFDNGAGAVSTAYISQMFSDY